MGDFNESNLRCDLYAMEYLKREGLYEKLVKLREQTFFTGCDPFDYAFLHNWVKTNKPKCFLEIGTGISTFVIAEAMKTYSVPIHGEKTVLVSVDNNEFWHKHAIQTNVANGNKFVQLLHLDIKETFAGYIYGTCYEQLPLHQYDCVFVDGPNEERVSVDFIFLVNKLEDDHPVTAIVDYRSFVMLVMAPWAGLDYVKRYNDLYVIGPVTKARYKTLTENQISYVGHNINTIMEKVFPKQEYKFK